MLSFRYGTLFLTAAFLILFGALPALGSPASLTYQGRILKSDGSPLEHNNVSFIFQITNPTGSCIIYQEYTTGYSMTNSGGVFDLPIGSGSISYPTGGGFSILDAFNNTGTYTCGSCSGYTCSNGTGSYVASAGDERKLRVQFYDGTGWRTISPDNVIRSVPFAGYSLSAEKLGSFTASDFVRVNKLPSGSCSAGQVVFFDGNNFSCVTDAGGSGVISDVLAGTGISVTGTTSKTVAANFGTAAGTIAQGNDSRIIGAFQTSTSLGSDLAGNLPNPTVVQIQGRPVSNSAPASNQVLKWNGTTWAPAADDGVVFGSQTARTVFAAPTGSAGSPTFRALNIGDVFSTVGGLSFLNTTPACSAGRALVYVSATDRIECADITVTLAGDVSGAQGATSVDRIKGRNVAATAPTSGQVLKWDGAQWAPSADTSNSGTVTSVATGTGLSGGPITSTGTISLADTAVTAGSYGSATAVPTFTVDAQGRLTAASSTTVTPAWTSITGKPTTIAGYGITDAVSSTLTSGQIRVGNASNVATAVAPSGDVSMTNVGVFTVDRIKGVAVSPAAYSSGQVLRYNGTSWVNSVLSSADLSNNSDLLKASNMPANCSASQTLTFSSPTGTWVCSNISGLNASVITAGTIDSARLPASATYWSSATGGINYAGGNVGIGASSPGQLLTVAGTIESTTGGFKFPDGTVQTSAAFSGTNNTMTAGFPDVIRCYVTNPNWGWRTLYIGESPYVQDGRTYYRELYDTVYVAFNSDRSFYSASGYTAHNCNVSITTLYNNGQAFNMAKGPAAQWLQNGTSAYYNAGNVGIGVSTPVAKLDLSGELRLKTPGLGSAIYFSNTDDPTLYLRSGTPGSFSDRLVVRGDTGNVGIGTTNPGYKLDVSGEMRATGNIRSDTGNFHSGQRVNFHLALQSDRNMVLYDGGAIWNSGTQVSDIRYKHDIKPLEAVLDVIMQLDTIRFKYLHEVDEFQKPQIGVIAQQIKQHYPELIYYDKKSDRYMVYYDKLTTLLIKGMQELKRQKDREISSLREEQSLLKAELCRKEPSYSFCK